MWASVAGAERNAYVSGAFKAVLHGETHVVRSATCISPAIKSGVDQVATPVVKAHKKGVQGHESGMLRDAGVSCGDSGPCGTLLVLQALSRSLRSTRAGAPKSDDLDVIGPHTVEHSIAAGQAKGPSASGTPATNLAVPPVLLSVSGRNSPGPVARRQVSPGSRSESRKNAGSFLRDALDT